MERRAAYKRAATTTNNQKQMRVDRMTKQRKESRASKFQNARNFDAQDESPRSNTLMITEQNAKPVLKEAEKKKNLKESLQKWREEKQKRHNEAARQKQRKPEFVVSRHCQSKPVTALTSVRNTTYRNVVPRVVSRRDTSSGSMLVSFNVPEKFNFKGFKENYGETTQKTAAPFVFAAPQTSLGADAIEPKKTVTKKTATFAFNTPGNASSTPKTFPVTPRPSKSGLKSTSAKGIVNKLSALNAPTKQFIADSPLSSQMVAHKIVVSPQPPPIKKRRTNDGAEEIQSAAAVGSPEEQSDIAIELSTDFFRQILENEINTLEQYCVLWEAENIKEVPEEIEEKILLAVGMARLLIREKFKQFRGLIQNCDEPEDVKTKTLLSDLQGFWDMIKIQADNIGAMFSMLEKLKANNWEEQKPEVKSKVAVKRKVGAPKTAKPAVSSKFKAFLAQKKAILPDQEPAAKTPGSNKKTPNMKTRKSGSNTPLINSKQRLESPNVNAVNAIISVSHIAKSAERRSLDNLANKSIGDTSFSGLKTPSFKSPQKTQPATESNSRTATPSRSILKKPELTPVATKGSRTVLFDIITEEEEDIDLAIPPVKHTYAQNNDFSPLKDDFDLLLENSAKAVTPASQFQNAETPKSVELSAGKKRNRKSQSESASKPVRRSTRLQILNESANDDLSHSGTRIGRKRSAAESELAVQLTAEEATHNDSNVSKRRSSRKVSSNSNDLQAACGSDLISFDSPVVKVTKRRVSAKKTLMD